MNLKMTQEKPSEVWQTGFLESCKAEPTGITKDKRVISIKNIIEDTSIMMHLGEGLHSASLTF